MAAGRVVVGSAWIELRADASGLRRQIKEEVDKAGADQKVKIKLDLDATGLREKVKAEAEKAGLGQKIKVHVDVDSRSSSRFDDFAKKLTGAFQLGSLSNIPYKFIAIGGAALAALPAVVSLVDSLGLASMSAAALAPALIGMGAAALVVKGVFGDLKTGLADYANLQAGVARGTMTQAEATAKWNAELARMSPLQRANVEGIQRLQNSIKQFDLSVTQRGLGVLLGGAQSNIYQLRYGVEGMSAAIGHALTRVGDLMKTPLFHNQLKNIFADTTLAADHMGGILSGVVRIFMNISEAASPLLVRFADWLDRSASKLADMTDKARGSGALSAFFKRAGDEAAKWGRIIGNLAVTLYNVFHGGGANVGSFSDKLLALTTRWKAWTENPGNIAKIQNFLAFIGNIDWGRIAAGAGAMAGLAGSLKLLGGAMSIISGAVSAGPIGLVVLAVLALGAAFVALYTHVKPFRDYINNNLLPVFKELRGWVAERLLPALSAAGSFISSQMMPAFKSLAKTINDNKAEFREIGDAIIKILPVLITVGTIIGVTVVGQVRNLISLIGLMVDEWNWVWAIGVKVAAWVADAARWFKWLGVTIWHAMVDTKDWIVNTWNAIFSTVGGIITGIVKWISDKWTGLKDTLAAIGNAVADGFKGAFDRSVEFIRNSLNSVRELINKGIGVLNVPLNWVGLSIPVIPAFADGGLVGARGYASGGHVRGPGGPRDDKIDAKLSNDEYVIKAASVKKIGLAKLNHANETGDLSYVNGDASGMRVRANRPLDFGFADGGDVAGRIAATQAWLHAQAGKPYVMGSAGPDAYDCSGLVGAVLKQLEGQNPYGRIFSTSNEGNFFDPGFGGANDLNVGWFGGDGAAGHTVGSIGGLNFEATPPRVLVGNTNMTAGMGAFTHKGHHKIGGGVNFDGGGSGGGGGAGFLLRKVLDAVKPLMGGLADWPLGNTGGVGAMAQAAFKKVPAALLAKIEAATTPIAGAAGAGAAAALAGGAGSTAQKALRQAVSMGATHDELLALFETGLVESNFANSSTATDHDSVGFLQQRPSAGWGTVAQIMDPAFATRSFISRIKGTSGSPGERAQKVQVSAFPDRYEQRAAQAAAMLKAMGAPGFINGGIVPGQGSGDTTAILAEPGERVLNRAQTRDYDGGSMRVDTINVTLAVSQLQDIKDIQDFFDMLKVTAKAGTRK